MQIGWKQMQHGQKCNVINILQDTLEVHDFIFSKLQSVPPWLHGQKIISMTTYIQGVGTIELG